MRSRWELQTLVPGGKGFLMPFLSDKISVGNTETFKGKTISHLFLICAA